jgi:hypothetical protein
LKCCFVLVICISSGQDPQLKFIQLYTSPTYEDFHSLLLQPDEDVTGTSSNRDEDTHRFSPVICRGVCDGGQIVWANTRISQGLTGRDELPLNTAVGVPICSIGCDTYILVLFAVEIITMTPQAIEYLATVSRAVTEGSSTFLSPSFSQNAAITQAKTEDFVGLWDIGELVRKYSSEVEFHLLPIGKLQKYFDCNEILLFCDFFTDFKTRRDGRFTVKQLEGLRDSYKQARKRSDSVSSITSKGWEGIGVGAPKRNQNSSDADLTSYDESGTASGLYNVDITTIENDLGLPIDEPSTSFDNQQVAKVKSEEYEQPGSVLHVYAHFAYKLSQCRFHEFMISILGMTVFESSELWLLSEQESDLSLVAGVYRNSSMQKWIAFNENIKLKVGASGPGRIVATGGSHWEMNYSTVADDNDPRRPAAKQHNVNTSFGVPLHGFHGVCGALMFYSSKSNFAAEPLLILLVERAVQLITTSNVESGSFLIDNTSTDPNTASAGHSSTLNRWLLEDHDSNVSPGEVDPAYLSKHLASVDYDQKLEMCRSIVHSKDFVLQYPPDPSENYPQFSGNTFNMNHSSHSNDIDHHDPEAAAALALANIGRVDWKNFLQGSNNGIIHDGGGSGFKLESNKLLAVYDDEGVLVTKVPSQKLHKCKVDDCDALVENASVFYCATHRNMRKCQQEGCNKCAQGATKFCIAHGMSSSLVVFVASFLL